MGVHKRLWMTKVFMATSSRYQHRRFFMGEWGVGGGRQISGRDETVLPLPLSLSLYLTKETVEGGVIK